MRLGEGYIPLILLFRDVFKVCRKGERERDVQTETVRYGYTDVLLYTEAERPKQYMASCSDMRMISSMRCLQMLTCHVSWDRPTWRVMQCFEFTRFRLLQMRQCNNIVCVLDDYRISLWVRLWASWWHGISLIISFSSKTTQLQLTSSSKESLKGIYFSWTNSCSSWFWKRYPHQTTRWRKRCASLSESFGKMLCQATKIRVPVDGW